MGLQGQSLAPTAAGVETHVQSYGFNVADIAALRALGPTDRPPGQWRTVDAQDSFYEFEEANTDADDGDLTIKPTDLGGGDPGRWIKRAGTGMAPTAHAPSHAANTGSDKLSTAAAGAIAIGDAAAVGAAETFARSDHKHSLAAPAAPSAVSKETASAGTAAEPARADHKHTVFTAIPVAISSVNAEGSAASLPRSDHAHDHGAQTVGTHHAAAIAAGANGFMTGVDKTKLDGIAAGATVGADAIKIHLVGTSAAFGVALQFIVDNPLVQFHIIRITASFTFVTPDNPTGTVTTPFRIEPDFISIVIPHKITWGNGAKIDLDTNVVVDAVDMDYAGGVGDNRWRYPDAKQGSFIHKNLTIDYAGGKSVLQNQFDGHCRFEFHNCKITSTSSGVSLCETLQNIASLEVGVTDVAFIGCNVKGRICRADNNKEVMKVAVISSVIEDNGNGIWETGTDGLGQLTVKIDPSSRADVSSAAVIGTTGITVTRFSEDQEVENGLTTTDATLTTIATIPISDNTVVLLEVQVAARRTDVAGRASYVRRAAVFREAAGAATIEGAVDTPFTRESAGNTAWDVTIAVSGNNAIVQVTGEAAKTINWKSFHKTRRVG